MKMDYAHAVSIFEERHFFGVRPGLERITKLLSLIGEPQKKLRFIHIAGSNGKGSTGAFISSALTAAGFKTGFYTSPHLLSVRERFRIDGKAVPPDRFAELMGELAPKIGEMDKAGEHPTYFEIATALAALYFRKEKVDFAVWETGMGGRLDATNAIDSICSVITGISLEHTEQLGDSLEKIAWEKAGIIKHGKPVFCGFMPEPARKTIVNVALERDCPVILPEESHPFSDLSCDKEGRQAFSVGGERVRISLAGDFQLKNAVLSYAVVEHLSKEFKFPMRNALKGFASARWPGRFQTLPDGSIIDGAHNPESVEHLVAHIERNHRGEKFPVVFGNLADKDTATCLRHLSRIASKMAFAPFIGPKPSRPPEELVMMMREISPSIPCETFHSPMEAVRALKGAPMIVTGSLYMVGEVLRELVSESEILDL